MWRRRSQRVEASGRRAARAEQERKDLRDRLTSFEGLARAAGVHLGSAEPDVVSEVPPSVIAAAAARRPGGLPVVVDVGARKIVAVTGPAGDPREWMATIAAAASLSLPAGQVTRIERVPMPAGLLAAAAIPAAGGPAAGVAENLQAAESPRRHRPAHRRHSRRRSLPGGLYRETPTGGGLAVRVADTLTAAEARRAAVAAVSAARRNGWQASQTAAIIPVIAAAAVWHAAAISGRVAIFCGVTAATATAAGVAFAVLPGHPVVPLVRVSPLPATAAHAHAHSYIPARKDARHLTSDSEPATTTPDVSPSHMPVRQPQGSAKPERSTSARVPPSRSPSPRPTTSAPMPSPTPSPSPSASGTANVCLGVLILNICVPL